MSAPSGDSLSTTSALTTATGSTNTNNNRNGNNNNSRNQNGASNTGNNGNNSNNKKFDGATKKLNGNVFEMEKGAAQFSKTTAALKLYAATELKESPQLSALFETTPTQPTIARPDPEPTPTGPNNSTGKPTLTTLDKTDHELSIKEWREHRSKLNQNSRALFAVIYGQCDEPLRTRIESDSSYEDRLKDGDCLWLLSQIRTILSKFDSKTKSKHESKMESIRKFLNVQQSNYTQTEFYNFYRESYTTLMLNNALGTHPDTVFTQEDLAIHYICATKHGDLKKKLRENYSIGIDKWPTTLAAAYDMVVSYEAANSEQLQSSNRRDRNRNNNNNTTKNSNSVDNHSTSTPSRQSGQAHGQMFRQSDEPQVFPLGTIGLDTLATHSVIRDPSLVTDIRPHSQDPLDLHTQAGVFTVHDKASFIGFPGLRIPVWSSSKSVGNILALRDVVPYCRVTMDSFSDDALIVHCPGNITYRFGARSDGLYVCDSFNEPGNSSPVTPYFGAQTVSAQKQRFTTRQVRAAELALDLYRKVNRPNDADFIHFLNHGHILNCPVTADDFRRARLIFGPDIPFLKGHTTNRASSAPHVPLSVPTSVPPYILTDHSQVILCVDFFYVQGLPFLHIISRTLSYRHTFAVSDRSAATVLPLLQEVLSHYRSRGFSPAAIHADSEFQFLPAHFPDVSFHFVPLSDHVPEVERSIRTIKEDARTVIHGLPYQRLPVQFIRHLIHQVTDTLNRFPRAGNPLLRDITPDIILTGRARPNFSDLHFEFGTYVQTFDKTTNTIRARTHGAIVLDKSQYDQDTYNLLSLASGQLIKQKARHCTELPIPDIAIRMLETLALKERQPLIQMGKLLIEWRPNQPFDPDDILDPEYIPPLDDDADDHVLGPEFHHDPDDLLTEDTPEQSALLYPVDSVANTQHNDITDAESLQPDNDNDDEEFTQNNPVLEIGADENNNEPVVDLGADDIAVEQDAVVDLGADDTVVSESHDETPETHVESTETNVPRYNTRGNKIDYSFRLAEQMNHAPTGAKSYQAYSHSLHNIHKTLTGLLMNQMSAKKGIRMFGEQAREALRKEFRQLIEKHVFTALFAHDLTPNDRKRVLRVINLIKEKRSGLIKGRTVADGRAQKLWYEKAETYSPTCGLDSFFLSLIIDAHEGRDVAIADVTGAYLNAFMDELVIVMLTGEDVDLISDVCPAFQEYVAVENGERVLYLRLDRALYGCVRSALLWYKMFSDTLAEIGFEVNPYDPCVANATFEGSQCTVVFYVDDNKISHKNPQIVDFVINHIESKFGPMTKTHGSKHEFLGMNFEFLPNRRVVIAMPRYLEEAIADCGMDITFEAATPATKSLFDVDDSSPLLVTKQADVFRSIVSKLLYVGLRGRPDFLVTLCFLCSRVQHPTVQDQNKLKRLLQYAKGTLDLTLTLGADDLTVMSTFVDAAYGVHPDFRSQTGGTITFGIGGIVNRASKQKINTKSSTEAELVGASDYLSNTIWVMNFLEAQGYPVHSSFFEQDNESAIKLAKNGRSSAGQKSRHIHNRFFWITDRLKTDGITIRHCPTTVMLADFLTKPLQGSLFRKFRDAMLGYVPMSTLRPDVASSPKERVEYSDASTTDEGLLPLTKQRFSSSRVDLLIRSGK
jgi:hypothetical protein